jgi:hypothetical protein
MSKFRKPKSPSLNAGEVWISSGGCMNYKTMLQIGYEHAVVNAKECGASGLSKLNFLANDLFDFTTYENEFAELMARKTVEVGQAITDSKTFDYKKQMKVIFGI